MKLFSFDPFEASIKIRLAMAYTPRVRNSDISYRPYNGFLFVVKGRYNYTFENGSVCAGAGEMIYLPANSIPYHYEVSGENGEEPQTMQIEFEVTDKSGEKLSFSQSPQLLCIPKIGSIVPAVKAVIAAYTSSDPSAKFTAVSELLHIVSLCEQNRNNGFMSGTEKNIAPAVNFIEEHYAEPIKSEDLADLCSISPSQLRRNFNAVYGMSPLAYKRNVVLKMAKQMLRTGEFKVGEVAEMLGFNDIYEFSHFFRKETGMSPRAYLSERK